MAGHWYVLACVLRKEQLIYRRLLEQGYEVFYPSLRVQNKGSSSSRLHPIFPGYLFVFLDLNKIALSTFQTMPMTDGLVCLGTKPAYVPDQVIQAIRLSLETGSILNEPPMPDAQALEHPVEKMAHQDRKILDLYLPSGDRIRELFKLLRGMEGTLGMEISPNRDFSPET